MTPLATAPTAASTRPPIEAAKNPLAESTDWYKPLPAPSWSRGRMRAITLCNAGRFTMAAAVRANRAA